MNPYTVLLLYPDYLAENYGEATYLAHVWAETPEIAIRRAQRDVWVENNPDDEDTEGEPSDFMPMLCIEGHHHDQTNPDLLELVPDLERAQ